MMRFLPWILVLAASSAPAQSLQPKPGPARSAVAAATTKRTVTMLIRSDLDCRVRLNGEDFGQHPAGGIVRFEALLGDNIIDLRSLDGLDRWVQIVRAEEPGGQRVVLADLSEVVQARLDREAVLAAQQAQLLEQAKERASQMPGAASAAASSRTNLEPPRLIDDPVRREREHEIADQRLQREEERRQRALEQQERRREAEETARQRGEERRQQLLVAAERAESEADRCAQELVRWESFDDPNDAARGLKTMNENCIRSQRAAAERLRREAASLR